MNTNNINTQTRTTALAVNHDLLFEDFKTSIVIVSLVANLAVFVTWLATTISA